MSLIKILSNTNQYNAKLALKFGVDCAAVFHYLVSFYGFNRIKKDDLKDDLEPDTGVNISIIKKMVENSLLKEDGEFIYANKLHPFFEEDVDLDEFELAMLSAATKVNYTIFEDEEFETLLNKWNNEVILKRYGRIHTKVELKLKFADWPYDVALEALKHSYAGKFVTLNIDYARQRIEQRGDSKLSRTPKKGFTTRGISGNDGRGNQGGKTQDKPTSSFSKRAISIEE